MSKISYILCLRFPKPYVKSPATPSGRDMHAGASRKGNIVLIVPLTTPAYPASAGRGTCRPRKEGPSSDCGRSFLMISQYKWVS